MFAALAITAALLSATVCHSVATDSPAPRQPRMRYMLNGLAAGLGL